MTGQQNTLTVANRVYNSQNYGNRSSDNVIWKVCACAWNLVFQQSLLSHMNPWGPVMLFFDVADILQQS